MNVREKKRKNRKKKIKIKKRKKRNINEIGEDLDSLKEKIKKNKLGD